MRLSVGRSRCNSPFTSPPEHQSPLDYRTEDDFMNQSFPSDSQLESVSGLMRHKRSVQTLHGGGAAAEGTGDSPEPPIRGSIPISPGSPEQKTDTPQAGQQGNAMDDVAPPITRSHQDAVDAIPTRYLGYPDSVSGNTRRTTGTRTDTSSVRDINAEGLRALLERAADLRRRYVEDGLALQESKQKLQTVLLEDSNPEHHLYLSLALAGEQMPVEPTDCHGACQRPEVASRHLLRIEQNAWTLSSWIKLAHSVFIMTILYIIFRDYV